jgi:hypothetical protein
MPLCSVTLKLSSLNHKGATEFEHDDNNSLPAGFPKSIASPTAWSGAELTHDRDAERYSIALTDVHISEIEKACNGFKGESIDKLLGVIWPFLRNFRHRQMLICSSPALGLPLQCISQDTFPLPILSAQLKMLAAQLTSGVGFFHIRGLDPQRYSNETNVIIYLGISAYVGSKRGRQDELGNMLRAYLMDAGVSWLMFPLLLHYEF